MRGSFQYVLSLVIMCDIDLISPCPITYWLSTKYHCLKLPLLAEAKTFPILYTVVYLER